MTKLKEDEAAQRLGLVIVLYDVGTFHDRDKLDFGRPRSRLLESLPCRLAAMHYCFSDSRLWPKSAFTMMILSTHVRVRFRSHFGKVLVHFRFRVSTTINDPMQMLARLR